MNPVLLTIYDRTAEQHQLSRAAFDSARAQDIPVDLFVVDNGSTYPETREWIDSVLETQQARVFRSPENGSPVKASNDCAYYLFRMLGCTHFLAIPNDVVLPPNLYREFLRWPRGVVTGSMTGEKDFPVFESATAVNECTPMAVCLIRRWAYDALLAKDGYFLDPGFFFYASDCDFALRLAACGIRGVQLDLQYWHYGSASHRLAISPGAFGADADRGYFERKWGFGVSDLRYGQSAVDINFLGEALNV